MIKASLRVTGHSPRAEARANDTSGTQAHYVRVRDG